MGDKAKESPINSSPPKKEEKNLFLSRPVHAVYNVQYLVQCTESQMSAQILLIQLHTDYRFLDFFNKRQLGDRISAKKIFDFCIDLVLVLL